MTRGGRGTLTQRPASPNAGDYAAQDASTQHMHRSGTCTRDTMETGREVMQKRLVINSSLAQGATQAQTSCAGFAFVTPLGRESQVASRVHEQPQLGALSAAQSLPPKHDALRCRSTNPAPPLRRNAAAAASPAAGHLRSPYRPALRHFSWQALRRRRPAHYVSAPERNDTLCFLTTTRCVSACAGKPTPSKQPWLFSVSPSF